QRVGTDYVLQWISVFLYSSVHNTPYSHDKPVRQCSPLRHQFPSTHPCNTRSCSVVDRARSRREASHCSTIPQQNARATQPTTRTCPARGLCHHTSPAVACRFRVAHRADKRRT
ncbi:hypothetical protein PFISCL1PPCAC_18404, partial [Pristionchus fissidentatus]